MADRLKWLHAWNSLVTQSEKPHNDVSQSPVFPAAGSEGATAVISIYLLQCLHRESVPQSSTRGNTRPLGSQPSGSHLAPHTPRPHTLLFPCHTHRFDTTLGSISDCWSRPFRFLYSCLSQAEQQWASGPDVHVSGRFTPSTPKAMKHFLCVGDSSRY